MVNETIKKGDFVEIEYTGKLKNSDTIFDLTDEKTAKEKKIFNPNVSYGPKVICVGEGEIIKGLDTQIENKEVGLHYTIELTPEQAFGKKNPKLIRTFPITKFKDQKVNPVPGMQVNMDGYIGMIRAVTGGRIIVDFNHPLSGKEVIYEVKITKVVTSTTEKLKGYLRLHFSMKDPQVEIKEDIAEVKIEKELPKEFEKEISKRITDLIKPLKEVKFIFENK